MSTPRQAGSAPLRFGFPKERSHIHYFTRQARKVAPLHAMAPVDMTRVRQAQERHLERGRRVSTSAFVTKAAALALRRYPQANQTVRHSWTPRTHRPPTIDGKVLLHKRMNGVVSVAAAMVPGADQAGLLDIQRVIDGHRDTPYERNDDLRGLRMLHRLPFWLGGFVYQALVRDPRRRARLEGSFSVTEVSNTRVTVGFTQIVNTLGFVAAATVDTPVVRDGQVVIRPLMNLVLAFDHSAVDGALGARVLDKTCHILENWSDS